MSWMGIQNRGGAGGVAPSIIQEYSNESQGVLVVPAAGLTWTASNNGGKVRLTTAADASHGLTTAGTVTAGASLYISAGTGWTVGLHRITAVDDGAGVRTVDLDTDWTGQSAPTVAAASASATVVMKTITVPALRANSRVEVIFNVTYPLASTVSRRTIVKFGGTEYLNNNVTTSSILTNPYRSGFVNLNSTASQKGLHGVNSTGYAGNSQLPATTTVDTSVPTTLTIEFLMSAANAPEGLDNYLVMITG